MANQYISKIRLNPSGPTYFLKDEEVRAAVKILETAAASSLVFKGAISQVEEITSLTDYKTGWTYKISSNFSIPDIGVVENGDMIICIKNNSIFNASDWTIVQNNVDVMTGAKGLINGTKGLVPAPKVGEESKFLRGDGTWADTYICQWGDINSLT